MIVLYNSSTVHFYMKTSSITRPTPCFLELELEMALCIVIFNKIDSRPLEKKRQQFCPAPDPTPCFLELTTNCQHKVKLLMPP